MDTERRGRHYVLTESLVSKTTLAVREEAGVEEGVPGGRLGEAR